MQNLKKQMQAGCLVILKTQQFSFLGVSTPFVLLLLS